MGAWGAGTFENDSAADWAADLAEAGSVDLVRDALVAAAEPEGGYLEAPAASEALAAAEVVAAAAGRPPASNPYCEDALAWADAHPEAAEPELLELANRAVARVGAAESELRDLWLEDEDVDPADAAEWTRSLQDLRRRLG